MDGYNDAVNSDTESAARVRNQDHHNPDGERKLLAELLHEQQNHGRLIHLGSNVEIALFQKAR
jgi:hypothetical protein